MRVFRTIPAVAGILCLLLAEGCSSGRWRPIPVASPPEVFEFPGDASVRILKLEPDPQLDAIADAVSKRLPASGTGPEYLLALRLRSAVRPDDADAARYNQHIGVQSSDNGSAARTFVGKTSRSAAAHAEILEVSIYRTGTLSPEQSFSIALGGEGDQPDIDELAVRLTRALTGGTRQVTVFFPDKGEEQTRTAFRNLDMAGTFRNSQPLETSEDDLATRYMQCIAKEALDRSPATLREAAAGQREILRRTRDAELIRAAAEALGRIEVKLRLAEGRSTK